MNHKQELVQAAATALLSYGYTVYLAKSKEYGFYTDGKRVVCFGGQWNFSLDYSGNYRSERSGTGWQIAKDCGVLTKDEAKKFIEAYAPSWATTENVRYTTPEQHLATYGKSSGYTPFEEELAAVQ